jgi:hypothetical protein
VSAHTSLILADTAALVLTRAVPVRPIGNAFPDPDPRPPDNFETSYRPSPGSLKPGVGSHRAKLSFSLKQQSVFHNRASLPARRSEPIDSTTFVEDRHKDHLWISQWEIM